MIAVSTSGKSPALAKKIRKNLADQFGREYERFLILMGKLRSSIIAMGYSPEENSKIFHALVDSPILEAISKNDLTEAASSLNKILGIQLSAVDLEGYLEDE